MSKHVWSHPVCIYESACGFRCRGCGAHCFGDHDGPTLDDLAAQLPDPVPEDCNVARIMVEAGKLGWNQKELPPWREEDVGVFTWNCPCSFCAPDGVRGEPVQPHWKATTDAAKFQGASWISFFFRAWGDSRIAPPLYWHSSREMRVPR